MAERFPPALVGAVVTVVGVAALVLTDATDAFDRALIEGVRDPTVSNVLAFLGPTTELGSTGAVTLLAVLTLLLGVAIGPWRHGALGAATIGLAALGVELVKAVVARDRPDLLEPIIVERGFSFPSGHATLSMVAYGVLAVLVSRSVLARGVQLTVFVAVAVLVFLVGLSRVWLGAHYPTDVIAGWAAGGVVVLLFASLTRAVSREPAAAVADAGPGARRSDPPAGG